MAEAIDVNSVTRDKTFMIYGDSGTGKTEFAATFPRPYFLSDGLEKGYETILTMDRGLWYEPNVDPQIRKVKTPQEMVAELDQIPQAMKDRPGSIRTVVIDSLTFYADLYYNYLERIEGTKDTRKLYGMLKSHLRAVMQKAHSIEGVHVVWLALAKVEEGKAGANISKGGIELAGKSAITLPGAVHYWLYKRVSHNTEKDALEFHMHTRQWEIFPARVRGQFPADVPARTYREFSKTVGWQDEVLPPLKGKK